MTDSISAVRGQLWPVPDQMKIYLDNWVAYCKELEERIKTLQEARQTSERALTERISQLRTELTATEQPLLQQISSLETSQLQLRADNDSLRAEMDTAVGLLAQALEIKGTRLALLTLANEAVILIEEAKKQLRESL